MTSGCRLTDPLPSRKLTALIIRFPPSGVASRGLANAQSVPRPPSRLCGTAIEFVLFVLRPILSPLLN